jgi:uncharacterized membrane protein
MEARPPPLETNVNPNRSAVWCAALAAVIVSTFAGAAEAAGPAFGTAVVAAAGSAAGADGDLSLIGRLWYSQGHMHPIVVHLPIGLLMAAAGAVVVRVVTKKVTLGMIYFCLAVGTAGAIFSTLAGWAWAPQLKPGWDSFDSDSPFFWHRWGGVIITVASVVLLVFATARMRKPEQAQWPWQAGLLAVTVGMGMVGHEGGELVYEENGAKIIGIATGDRKPKFQRKEVIDPGKSAVPVIAKMPAAPTPPGVVVVTVPPGATQPAAATEPGSATQPTVTVNGVPAPGVVAIPSAGSVDFGKQVWPIFEAKCIYCHGADENKGEYRMHTRELALKGGESGNPSILPGDSKASPFVKHMSGENTDDFSLMPPKKEKKPVTPDELALMKKWIDEGAAWNK